MIAVRENKFFKETLRFFYIVDRHNIFLLSSSLAYYTALALAPFLLILFSLTSVIGSEHQERIIRQISLIISPQVADLVKIIMENSDKAVDTTSLTGVVGIGIILFTASVVFLHLRYSFNLIFNFYDPDKARSLWEIIRERLVSMGFVLLFNLGFVLGMFLTSYVFFYLRKYGLTGYGTGLLLTSFNFAIFFVLFFCLYYFVPSKRPSFSVLVRSSTYASLGFLVGKILFGIYFKNIVSTSVYGAAGALLIFLIWTYYSALILFFSAEFAQYLKIRNQ
jgi:membrane protein